MWCSISQTYFHFLEEKKKEVDDESFKITFFPQQVDVQLLLEKEY
jgi:hypothetical protein